MYAGQTASSSSEKTASMSSGRCRNEKISRLVFGAIRSELHLHDRRRHAEPLLERAVEIGEVVEADREGDVADLAAARRFMKQQAAGEQEALLDDKLRERRVRRGKHALHLTLAEAVRPRDHFEREIGVVEML